MTDEQANEITGLRNSYWEERKARLALEARCAELEKVIERAREARDKAGYVGMTFFEAFDLAAQELAALRNRIERESVVSLVRWAHDNLYEINPDNYDHDEVCKLNDASVEVIFGLARFLGENHGKSAAWWAEYDAKHPPIAGAPERVEAEPAAWIKDVKYRRFVRFTDPKCGSWDPVFYASPPAPVMTDALRAAQEVMSSLNEWFAQREDGKATTNSEEVMFAKTSQIDALIEAALASREANR